MVGAEVAAITHGHPLGYIPAAAFVHIIVKCVTSSQDIESIVEDAARTAVELFHDKKHINEFENIMKKAVRLAHEDMDDLDAIREIGQGWVAEETLAIVYSESKEKCDSAAEFLKKAITIEDKPAAEQPPLIWKIIRHED